MTSNWYYRSKGTPMDGLLLATEGPSTFIALHFGSLILIEDLEQIVTFDQIKERFPAIDDHAWESFRAAFDRFWPARRKDVVDAIIDANTNRKNGQTGGRPKKQAKFSTPEPEPFSSASHEGKPIWPHWLRIRKIYPGTRISDWDFLVFEAEVTKGEDPEEIVKQTKAYCSTFTDGFEGYNFKRFIAEGFWKGTFKPAKKDKLSEANEYGKDALIARLGGM